MHKAPDLQYHMKPQLVAGLAGSCEVETGKSEVQGNPELHSEFESRLGYMKPCLKNHELVN